MNEMDNAVGEDAYAAIFGETEDALASGQTSDSIRVPAEVRPRLERDLACARLLRQTLGQGSSSGSSLSNSIDLRKADSGTVIRCYRLLEKLGEGGMGIVFKALHQELNKVVVVKLIRNERVRDADAAARFKREIQAVGSLEHPHIVRAFDAGEVDGTLYLAMEYVAGVDLEHVVNQLGPLGVADACAIVQQAALGLQHAHESGRVHRDIKPSNLILWNSGASEMASVKIVDFGLALLVHRADGARNLTGSGQIMGTLDYMAPEQGDDSHEVDHRADIYSLGATLYKLLSGESPLAAPATASPLQKVAALALGESIPLRDRRPDLPETIANLVDRLLDRNPANRPATAAEIAAQLEPFARTANLSDLLRMAREPGGEKRGSPSRTAKSSSIGRAKTLWIRRIVPTAIGVALMLLAATVVVRIATDKGELVIQSPDPNVKITVKRNGKPVEELELIAGESNVRVRSGEVEVILKGASIDKYEIKNDRFTLSRGDKPVIEITRKALANTQPTEANADRLVAEWVLSVGGWVCIDKERKEIKTESDLPKGQFTTTDVFVPRNRSVGDAEVLRLRGLTGLIVLDISETRVADNGIAQLSVHKGLGGLRAHGTLLTNMGVEHLKELKDLQYLKLGATAITDDALRHIKELPKLSDLGVQITAVSDAGLEHLRDQMSLTRLQLFKTRVSDDGLVHLYRLTRLVEVDVRETRVTAKGVSELRKALPKCKVIAD